MTYYSRLQKEDEPFRYRSYRKSELARLYFPQVSRTAALQNLRRWIDRCEPVRKGLKELGYDRRRQYYLKCEVEVIVGHFGEP